MAGLAERQDVFSAGFDAFRRDPAFGAHGLRASREAAFDRFVRRGWPSTRDEEWRHTSLAPMKNIAFERAAATVPDRALLDPYWFDDVAATVVVVNGRLSASLSTLDGLPMDATVRGLSGGTADVSLGDRPGANVFVDLNTALLDDAVLIDVPRRTVVDRPIHVLFVSAPGSRPTLVSPRLIVTAGEQASVSIIESYADLGAGSLFTNAVTDIRIAPAALVDHVKLQRHGDSFHLATMFVRAGRAGTFTSHAITLGGRIARNEILATLDGEGAECTLNGLYVATDHSLVDTHTTIDHAKAHCPSHEVYKGILGGHARAVFNGKILVRPDAQKTDAKQTNRALLLTDDAQINTKPQLEIFADDVKCTHGAAIGQLDEDALFYLQARGIDVDSARIMLIHAFAADVLGGIRSESVRLAALQAVDRKLSIA